MCNRRPGENRLPAGDRIAVRNLRMRAFLLPCLLAWSAAAQNQQRGPALKFLLIEGQGAINVVNQGTERNLTVRVEETYGAPGKEVRVTFTAPKAGPSGYFHNGERSVTTVTDSDGYAVARGFRPNHIAGQYDIQLRAAVPGGVITAVMPQTNAVSSPENREMIHTKLFWTVVAAAAAGGAAVRGFVGK
jgi:hypothetical protein